MSSIRSLVLFATILASPFSPIPATAAVIFDNGAPDLQSGLLSDVDLPARAADDFLLAAGQTTIRDIHWFGAYAGNNLPATDDFTIQIFSDSGGEPGAVPLLPSVAAGNVISRVPTGESLVPGLDVYAYSVDVSPIILSAGTPYWLSIFNNTSADPALNFWAWATSAVEGGNAVQQLGTQPWLSLFPYELAFNLTGDVTGNHVAEPSIMLLLGSGLAGLAAWRRRR